MAALIEYLEAAAAARRREAAARAALEEAKLPSALEAELKLSSAQFGMARGPSAGSLTMHKDGAAGPKASTLARQLTRMNSMMAHAAEGALQGVAHALHAAESVVPHMGPHGLQLGGGGFETRSAEAAGAASVAKGMMRAVRPPTLAPPFLLLSPSLP